MLIERFFQISFLGIGLLWGSQCVCVIFNLVIEKKTKWGEEIQI